MRKILLTITSCILFFSVHAQTLGGNAVFNFLKVSNSPQLTALGGINVSQITNDISMSYHNPALLRASMHGHVAANFNSIPGAINNFQLQTGYHLQKAATSLALGINYFDYGSIPQTDVSGNQLGEFRPRDYAIQVSASRSYGNSLVYGVTLKFINSNYGIYRSSGIALDVALTYSDSALLLQAGLVIKNMGVQLKSYTGSEKSDLPFDFQVGISKKLEKAPIQFSLTLHHLHRFNIRYDDSTFDSDMGVGEDRGNSYLFDKLFRHVVFATQLFIADKIEISAGYNYLRRKELRIGNAGNGLNGFSIGVGAILKKLQIRYGRTYFQNNRANNQIGLGFSFAHF
ncbi:MAG: type IX secretion system protein PorQ [Chitinophagaceae bacterium]|nr:type IX secretion system protein PorQ [Chitinophagaceae bacterium]